MQIDESDLLYGLDHINNVCNDIDNLEFNVNGTPLFRGLTLPVIVVQACPVLYFASPWLLAGQFISAMSNIKTTAAPDAYTACIHPQKFAPAHSLPVILEIR